MNARTASQSARMVAVIPVRGGVLPLGADETVAEAGGRALLVGDGAAAAATALPVAAAVRAREAPSYRPAAWAAALAAEVADARVVLLPASPDGRDLAPRLARALGRPLLAGAVLVRPGLVVLARHHGQVAEEVTPAGPFVATLIPGVRGVEPADPGRPPATVDTAPLTLPDQDRAARDAEVLEVLPPDPATMDLSEARRVVAGGQGLGGAAKLAELGAVAAALGASLGGTRVVTDAGWLPFERQIGTTGVAIDPELYLAFGISGAVQHTAGLGHPAHVVAVNLDPSCPMMQLADLAVVTDAPALVTALARRLGVDDDPAAAQAPAVEGSVVMRKEVS